MKEQEGVKKELLQKVEKLTKEKAEKEKKHVAEMDNVIAEVRMSAAIAVWEAEIKLAEDLCNARSWNVKGWQEASGKLTSEPAGTSQDPALQLKGGENVEVASGET